MDTEPVVNNRTLSRPEGLTKSRPPAKKKRKENVAWELNTRGNILTVFADSAAAHFAEKI